MGENYRIGHSMATGTPGSVDASEPSAATISPEPSQCKCIIFGGRVYDRALGVSGIVDVALGFDGKILAVEANLKRKIMNYFLSLTDRSSRKHSPQLYDATGCLVCPGLIDMHAHVYEHATPLGVNPDMSCLSRGVTTVCDAGSAGATTVAGLRHYIVNRSSTRVLAFLNISAHGLASAGCSGFGAGGELDSLNQVQVQWATRAVRENRDILVGFKIRLSKDTAANGKNEMEAYRRARQAARICNVPLMCHHTFSSIPHTGEHGCPGGLRRGDIYTHAFHGFPSTLVDCKDGEPGAYRVSESAKNARRDGVVFDVGHGAGSFSWKVAEVMAQEGIWPDVISTDLHKDSHGAPAYDLPTVMTKFLAIGMPIEDVVAAVTTNPARVIGWEDRIGSMRPGFDADITVLKLESLDTPLQLEDSQCQLRDVDKILRPIAVWRAGIQRQVTRPAVFPDTSYRAPGAGSCRWGDLRVADKKPPQGWVRRLGAPVVTLGSRSASKRSSNLNREDRLSGATSTKKAKVRLA